MRRANLRMRGRGTGVLWALLASGPLTAVPARAGTPDEPAALADLAVKANPAITSLQQEIAALGHAADAAVMWSDPVFAVEYSNVPWNTWALGESPMSGVQLKLQQTLPLPGKNDRRAEVVRGEAEVRRWELLERENQLRALVKRSYWQLALVRQLRAINQRHIALIDQLLASVRVRYEVGKVGQHDLLGLEVLKQKLQDDLGDFDQRDRALVAALNAALHRDAAAAVATPDALPLAAGGAQLPTLLERAQRERPLLQQARARSSWQRLAADQAGYERWPDLTVWAGYRFRVPAGADPGTPFVNAGIAVPLPVDYAGRAKARQEQHLAAAAAADASYDAAVDEVRAALAAALAAWQRAADKAMTYAARIIPGADQTLKATLAAYQSDRADFASLYQAELQLLQLEREATVARATTQTERSAVEAAIGADLAPAPESEVTP